MHKCLHSSSLLKASNIYCLELRHIYYGVQFSFDFSESETDSEDSDSSIDSDYESKSNSSPSTEKVNIESVPDAVKAKVRPPPKKVIE